MRACTVRIVGPTSSLQAAQVVCRLSLLMIAGCGSSEQAAAASGGVAALIPTGGVGASGGITEPGGGSSAGARITGGASAAPSGGSGSGSSAIGGSSAALVSRTTAQVIGSGGTWASDTATAAGGSTSGGRSPTTSGHSTGGSTNLTSTYSPSSGGTSLANTSSGPGGTTNRVSATTGGTTTQESTGGTSAGGASVIGGNAATGGAAVGGASSSATSGAPETQAMGFGQATTGCGSREFIDADSLAAVQKLIDDYAGAGGLCIRYTGAFDYSTIGDPCTRHQEPARVLEIKRKSEITLLGADASAADFGIHIASSSSNVIIRNMTLGLLPGGSASDAISIEGMSDGVPSNIWIDHNELFSSMVDCAGAGDTAFDGLIDAKKGADNITVSYNYVHDHHKVSLNGYSDTDDVTRHITFHHNVFENVGSRTPLQRYGYSHLLNNSFNGITVSGINVRMGGYSLIEGNYFEDCQNPVTSRDSTELGYWELRNNNIMAATDFAKYRITWEPSGDSPSKDATDWITTANFPIALGYTYLVDPPDCLKAGLAAVAGAGKGLATLKCR